MASEEQQAANRKLIELNLFNAQGAAPQQAETDAFQCGRCKQRRTMYYQVSGVVLRESFVSFSLSLFICHPNPNEPRSLAIQQMQTRSADEPMTVRRISNEIFSILFLLFLCFFPCSLPGSYTCSCDVLLTLFTSLPAMRIDFRDVSVV